VLSGYATSEDISGPLLLVLVGRRRALLFEEVCGIMIDAALLLITGGTVAPDGINIIRNVTPKSSVPKVDENLIVLCCLLLVE